MCASRRCPALFQRRLPRRSSSATFISTTAEGMALRERLYERLGPQAARSGDEPAGEPD